MDYHIARRIPQKHLKDNTLLYFADGTIGYIPSKEDIKDFCVVKHESGWCRYIDNLENTVVIERPFNTKWDNDLHIDTKKDFAIVLLDDGVCGFNYPPKGFFHNGAFFSKRKDDNLKIEHIPDDNLLSDSELAVVEEFFFPQLIRFTYREINPELLIELHNIAEVKLSGLNVDDIINSFTITGGLSRDCKLGGKDNDWTHDYADMKSYIKYSDSYIEHILPPQEFHGVSGVVNYKIPAYFYRDDLDSFLKEKAATMKNKAMTMYSKKEHIIFLFHKLLTDVLDGNSKYLEYKERVHNNYIEYWHNGKDSKVLGNKASKLWLDANVFVNNKITDSNIKEMIYEYNKSVPFSFV